MLLLVLVHRLVEKALGRALSASNDGDTRFFHHMLFDKTVLRGVPEIPLIEREGQS